MGKKVGLFILILIVVAGGAYGAYYLISGETISISNKTMTCTKENLEDGYKTTDTMEITYNSIKVLKFKDTNISETDPEYLDMSYNIGVALAEKLDELSGIDMKYEKVDNNKLKLTMSVEYGKIDLQEIKNAFGDLYDEENAKLYSSNGLTIDEFKTEVLNGYTCN